MLLLDVGEQGGVAEVAFAAGADEVTWLDGNGRVFLEGTFSVLHSESINYKKPESIGFSVKGEGGGLRPRVGFIRQYSHIMWANKFEEETESVEQPGGEEEQAEIKLQLNRRIHALMPANELRTVRRPENMLPRTFFLHRPFSLLPDSLITPTS